MSALEHCRPHGGGRHPPLQYQLPSQAWRRRSSRPDPAVLVAYKCVLSTARRPLALSPSHEHKSLAFMDPSALPDEELPAAYKQLIASR